MSTALDLIASERTRQVSTEAWTAQHDDQHTAGELACAAACYAAPDPKRFTFVDDASPDLWPWDDSWWKPTPDDRIRELVKAGALIVAEIERLQRAALGPIYYLTGEMLADAVAKAYGRPSYYVQGRGSPHDVAYDGVAATLRATGSVAVITGQRLMDGIEGMLGGPCTYENHPNDATRAVWDAAAADVRAQLAARA